MPCTTIHARTIAQALEYPQHRLFTPSRSAPELIDIGLNLAHDSFDHDRDAVIQRAAAAGVTRMVITGSSVASTRAAIELVRQRPAALSLHGGRSSASRDGAGRSPAGATCGAGARSRKSSAVGECGLDYFRNLSPRDAQRDAFREQLELAVATGKPVFLHQRDAHEDFVAILRRFRPRLAGGVAHCFTGGAGRSARLPRPGSVYRHHGWICDERRGLHLREVVRHIPADRLLIETDAPYLLPRDLNPKPQSRRNEPMYLPHVLERSRRRAANRAAGARRDHDAKRTDDFSAGPTGPATAGDSIT